MYNIWITYTTKNGSTCNILDYAGPLDVEQTINKIEKTSIEDILSRVSGFFSTNVVKVEVCIQELSTLKVIYKRRIRMSTITELKNQYLEESSKIDQQIHSTGVAMRAKMNKLDALNEEIQALQKSAIELKTIQTTLSAKKEKLANKIKTLSAWESEES